VVCHPKASCRWSAGAGAGRIHVGSLSCVACRPLETVVRGKVTDLYTCLAHGTLSSSFNHSLAKSQLSPAVMAATLSNIQIGRRSSPVFGPPVMLHIRTLLRKNLTDSRREPETVQIQSQPRVFSSASNFNQPTQSTLARKISVTQISPYV
jgi:hypothetical protein